MRTVRSFVTYEDGRYSIPPFASVRISLPFAALRSERRSSREEQVARTRGALAHLGERLLAPIESGC